jgi:hypothetical protein
VSSATARSLTRPRRSTCSTGRVRRGVLVDLVDGDLDVLYRRHSADFIRIVPLDDHTGEYDAENLEACMRYKIAIEPTA